MDLGVYLELGAWCLVFQTGSGGSKREILLGRILAPTLSLGEGRSEGEGATRHHGASGEFRGARREKSSEWSRPLFLAGGSAAIGRGGARGPICVLMLAQS